MKDSVTTGGGAMDIDHEPLKPPQDMQRVIEAHEQDRLKTMEEELRRHEAALNSAVADFRKVIGDSNYADYRALVRHQRDQSRRERESSPDTPGALPELYAQQRAELYAFLEDRGISADRFHAAREALLRTAVTGSAADDHQVLRVPGSPFKPPLGLTGPNPTVSEYPPPYAGATAQALNVMVSPGFSLQESPLFPSADTGAVGAFLNATLPDADDCDTAFHFRANEVWVDHVPGQDGPLQIEAVFRNIATEHAVEAYNEFGVSDLKLKMVLKLRILAVAPDGTVDTKEIPVREQHFFPYLPSEWLSFSNTFVPKGAPWTDSHITGFSATAGTPVSIGAGAMVEFKTFSNDIGLFYNQFSAGWNVERIRVCTAG